MVALHGTSKLREERAVVTRPAGRLPAVPLPPRQKKVRKAPLEGAAAPSSSSSSEPELSAARSTRTPKDTSSARASRRKPTSLSRVERHLPLSSRSRPASAPATASTSARRPVRSSAREPLPRAPAPKTKRKKKAARPATPRPAELPPEIDRCAEALQWLQAPSRAHACSYEPGAQLRALTL